MTIKMSIKDRDAELVFDDDQSRLNIGFSPEIKEYSLKFENEDYLLTQIFTWLKSFNLKIEEIRNKLGVKPVEYPREATVDDLVNLVFEVIKNGLDDNKKFSEFDDDIDKLRVTYQLTENWYLPLRIAVITDTLLVPGSETIRIHVPSYEWETKEVSGKSKTLLGLATSIIDSPEARRANIAMRLMKYPSIYFTRKTSIDELKKWIDSNKHLVKAIQYRLPSKKVIKRNQKTLFWGKIAWIFKQDGVNSWAKIAELAQQESEKIIEQQGEKGNEDLLNPPDGVEIRKYYQRFIDSLRTVDGDKK